jgi:hypothetical protein
VNRGRISETAVRWSYRATARLLGAIGLKEVVRQHLLPRLMGVLHSSDEAGAFQAVERHIEREIERIVAKPGPILVGPWLSEVGFELLYWIPMLRWIEERWNLDPERVVVVSRGGAQAWYQGLCGRYLDVFDCVAPDRYTAINRARWQAELNQKQTVRHALDEEIIDWARKQAGLGQCEVLHPALMYQLFWPIFQSRLPIEDLLTHVRYKRLPGLELPEDLAGALPKDYVAMRFYFRPSFPDTEANRRFVGKLARQVSSTIPVVLLNTGLRVDDHVDCPAGALMSLERFVTSTNNLDIQSRVIANARALVGTYGGLSYLAPFYGVPSAGFYSDERDLKSAHRGAAQAACQALGSRLVELHVDDLELLDWIGGRLPQAAGNGAAAQPRR